MADSLDGRVFVDATPAPAGDVGIGTEFEYHEEGDLVWARYQGGAVRLGYLVGTRAGDVLQFRYTHVTIEGQAASGRCESRVVSDGDRLRLEESWTWESKPGSGVSTLVERG